MLLDLGLEAGWRRIFGLMAASNNGTLVGLDIGGHPWIRVDPDAAARVFAELRKTVSRST